MSIVLKIIGWLGLIIAFTNGAMKIFGDDAFIARYAEATRNLDNNIAEITFCLIFLALAKIIDQTKQSQRMCGRVVDPNAQSEGFDTSWLKIDPFAKFRRFNVKPTNEILIATANEVQMARWWLIPTWFKGIDAKDWKATTFNARIEDAQEKPSFRGAWKYGRCLIPVGGYYEWTGEKGEKQPWYIRTKSNQENFFMAGLASPWRDTMTCTIMTRAANDTIKHVHTRMPVILNSDEQEAWLFGSNDLEIGSNVVLEAWRVATFKLDSEGEELIEAID